MTTFKRLFIASILTLAFAATSGTHNRLSAEQGMTLEELESMKGELISDYLNGDTSPIFPESGEIVISAQNFRDFAPELLEFIPEGILPKTFDPKSEAQARFFALAAKEYTGLIAYLDSQGASFDEIFREMCLHTVSSDSLFTNINPRFKIQAMFTSLYKWTKNGGKPEFQKREDLALHFIYGGLIESYFNGLGYIAAYQKEKRDAHKPGNYFDIDDMAATMLGARWACLAGRGFWGGTHWVKPWASGKKTLDKIPQLQFGRLAHGQIAGRTHVKAVKQFVEFALPADFSSADNFPSI